MLALAGVGGGALFNILGGHDGGAECLIHNVAAVLILVGVCVDAGGLALHLIHSVCECLTGVSV